VSSAQSADHTGEAYPIAAVGQAKPKRAVGPLLPEELRSRLSAINRGRAPTGHFGTPEPPAAAGDADYSRLSNPALLAERNCAASISMKQGARADWAEFPPVEEIAGGEVALCPAGKALVVEKEVSFTARNGLPLARAIEEALGSEEKNNPFREWRARGLRWLDVETAGFMGRPLIMAGILELVGERLSFTQIFARSYAEEAAVLWLLGERLSQAEAVVTFNGLCFDLPFVRTRMAYHRQDFSLPEQIDLLPRARRAWGKLLPNCRLVTLERHICRRARAGDISGEEIPSRYHLYMHTGDGRLLEPVFKHNRLDLLTLAELSEALASPGETENDDRSRS